MTARAIVLPYVRRTETRHGFTFTGAEVSIATDGRASDLAGRFPVGRLVEREAPLVVRVGKASERAVPMVREVTAEHVAGVVGAIVTLLRAREVSRVAVEAHTGTGVEAERSHWIARELVAACARCGLDVEAFDATTTPHAPPVARAALDTSRALAAELAASRLAPAVLPSLDVGPAPASAAARTLPLPHVEPAAASPADDDGADELAPAAPGARVAGIDPGTHYVAVAIVEVAPEGSPAPLRYLASHTFPLGRMVPRAKPKTYPDGRTSTEFHKVTRRDVERLIASVRDYLSDNGATVAVVERVRQFRGGENAHAVAAGLLNAQHVGGELAGALRACGTIAIVEGAPRIVLAFPRVETVSAPNWRALARARTGAANVAGSWRPGLRAAYGATWPWATEAAENSAAHEVDAAGVASALAPTGRKRAARRAPGEPAPKKDRHSKRGKARADKWAAWRAAGCKCGTRGPHVLGCPVRKVKP